MKHGSDRARVYRACLRLLPPDMRRRFGPEMVAMLLERLDAEPSRGRRALIRIGAFADLLRQAAGLRREARDARGGATAFVGDVRQAVAALRSSPFLTAASVATLGLGIGASTAVFSVADAVLRSPLPVHEPDRLVFVWPEQNGNRTMAELAEAEMRSLELVSGLSSWTLTLTGSGEPRELTGLQVSPNYFRLLGVTPLLGRSFLENEDLPGAADVVVLSHGLWIDAFGGDPEVVGRVIDLSGGEYERRRVVGVMPAGVERLWRDADVWVPLEGDPALDLQSDPSWYVNARLGRLAPDATLEQASEEVRVHARGVQRTLPRIFSVEEAERATVRTLRDVLTQDVRTPILVTLGAVLLVLFIGCFNVANLMLAQSDRRHRDLAVRAALGAGRRRLTRGLLAESGAVGILGGVVGVATAWGLVATLRRFAPPDFPGLQDVGVDAPVLAFALVATLGATLMAGLIPALRAGRVEALSILAGSSRGTAGKGAGRMTSTLVAAQVGLAVVVAVGSGLTLRSLTRLLAVDPGLDGDGVIAFTANPRDGDYPDGEAYQGYFGEVTERIAALPNVESVGGIHLLPGTVDNWSFPTHPEGFTVADDEPTPSVNFRVVRDDYFETVRLPILLGRGVANRDRPDTERVVAVNEAFVRTFWPDVDPLGRTLSIFSASDPSYRVVGVVADVRQHGRKVEPRPEMYFAHGQPPWDNVGMWMMVRLRSGPEPASVAPAIRDVVWSVNADVPVSEMLRLDDALGRSTRGARFLTLLFTAFGGLALALCAVGVFGVTAYVTGRRVGEFGVRVALGSSRIEIVRTSVARAFAPVAVGLALGLAAARLGSDTLSSVLYEIDATDPVTYVGVGALLALVGLMAAVVPAWRAANVDPVRVLGSE